MFLIWYGIFRILAEFVREPDAHIGFIAWGWLTKGQLLSLPMVLAGVALLIYAYRINGPKLQQR
jgi:phosphatidylglycerol:prolipoprotein diacylglycerol transferase